MSSGRTISKSVSFKSPFISPFPFAAWPYVQRRSVRAAGGWTDPATHHSSLSAACLGERLDEVLVKLRQELDQMVARMNEAMRALSAALGVSIRVRL